MVFVRGDIPSKLFSLEAAPIERLSIELKFREKKCLLTALIIQTETIYGNISNDSNVLRKSLD